MVDSQYSRLREYSFQCFLAHWYAAPCGYDCSGQVLLTTVERHVTLPRLVYQQSRALAIALGTETILYYT